MGVLYKAVVLSNSLLMIVALIVMGFCAYRIYEYDSGSSGFWSKETYLYIIIASVLTFLAGGLAILGIKNPRTQTGALFCYFCLLSVIIMLCAVALYGFVSTYESAKQTTSSSVVNNATSLNEFLSVYSARSFQDYVLSTYTDCCLGREENCNATVCTTAEVCSGGEGLGSGCYTISNEVPAFNVPNSFCNFLEKNGPSGKNLVAPPSEGGCGGGDPVAYVDDVFAYFSEMYYFIFVPACIFVGLLGINWLGAAYYNTCPNYADPTGAPAATVLQV